MAKDGVPDPQTQDEWQDAVDAAHALLHISSAIQYGLIEGGPEIDVERCEEILRRGEFLAIHPSPKALEKFLEQTVQ